MSVSDVSMLKSIISVTNRLQAPTVFPILFATVAGRATRSFLSWRIEKGERLGFLDLLANCTSVVNSLVAQFSLRTYSIAGITLAILWLLSPVGGQASLRMMSVGYENVTDTAPIAYLATDSNYAFWRTDASSQLTVAIAMYQASLLASRKMKFSPVDTWNNVKIPMIEQLEKDGAAKADSRWFDVPSSNVTYSALIGLPTTSLSPFSNNSYNMESGYWALDCPLLRRGTQFSIHELSRPNSIWSGPAPMEGSALKSNSSQPASSSSNANGIAQFTCNRTATRSNLEPRIFIYNSQDYDAASTATCKITTTYVEVEVDCAGSSCGVVRIRRSQKSHPPPAWTYLDEGGCVNWPHFAESFLYGITPKTSGDLPSITQGYIKDPENPSMGQQSPRSMADIGKQAFAIRFAQLLNTFWLTNIAFTSITGGADLDSLWLKLANDTKKPSLLAGDVTPLDFAGHIRTTVHKHKLVEVVQSHTGWLFALLLASTVLMIASVIPTMVRLFAHGPKFELTVSTAVRDNPYVETPAGGSALDSSRRSRLLKDLKVKLGDVCPEKGIGHLAVTSIDDGRFVDDIRKGRMYD